jgi:Enolase C-terminal domain-like/Protein of unknown function (DUF2380)
MDFELIDDMAQYERAEAKAAQEKRIRMIGDELRREFAERKLYRVADNNAATATIADASYVTASYHNPLGPIATAAAIQLDACTTNFVMQESFCEYDVPWRFDLLQNCPRPVNGRYEIPDALGLGGIDLNLDAVRGHPYREDAFLPMWARADWRKKL